MILVIDNYDSFTYNLVQLLGKLKQEVTVVRNDTMSVADLLRLKPRKVLISPGPGRPENSGIIVELIRAMAPTTPILGVCLGHQAIGYAFGGTVTHAPHLMHGKTSAIHHDRKGIFRSLPEPFEATRYHSLVISPEGLPADLEVSARTTDGIIMGVRHRAYPVEGIQFHPESILTTAGPQLIANWLEEHL